MNPTLETIFPTPQILPTFCSFAVVGGIIGLFLGILFGALFCLGSTKRFFTMLATTIVIMTMITSVGGTIISIYDTQKTKRELAKVFSGEKEIQEIKKEGTLIRIKTFKPDGKLLDIQIQEDPQEILIGPRKLRKLQEANLLPQNALQSPTNHPPPNQQTIPAVPHS